ncbi:TPA: hypothetical protein TVJ95_001166 [Streptococcus equi subsp. zooepidemicus]|uniref:hypothetical protein n=1 Tax=Streptococcus equi TaxID=1336 RepID=UPI001E5D165C|nr:hypothetical protein [Streptococcus equi]MCD3415004.1 hypothetical protein [Streptococcus equi subsp. zooepidemicus]HEL0588535.1 hypothetical protein [Streptococcus equi subsp. zooepidemicus]HEL1146214.1 hypothetical protein [Streptococcus equi subsp. zooepidemicus]HEL1536156.1 hypothetical protein [Streptococcus equi subsp. zooepidemicus]
MALRKQATITDNSMKRLGKKEDRSQRKRFGLTKSTLELLAVKRILSQPPHYIQLKDDTYLELMEISGKDLDYLSESEIRRTLMNFETWLTSVHADIQVETTRLPTNTDPQIAHLRHHLEDVKMALGQPSLSERRQQQLLDRKQLLETKIRIEEQIKHEIYNAEFILWLFAPTITDMDTIVRKVQTSGNQDFVPEPIRLEKKKQLLTQFYNLSDSL